MLLFLPAGVSASALALSASAEQVRRNDMQQRFAILISTAGLAFSVACSQTDAGVTTAVKSKMASDDAVKASEINVDTHDHVVTLNGTVGSRLEKERAVALARDTKGVTNVIDDLRVGPVATSGTYGADREADDRDDSAARQTTHDAKEKSEDKAHEAKVKTEDATHDAKAKSERAADKTGDALSDAAITSEVKTKFLAEPGVSGLAIDVDTSNGVVTLSGNVKSKAEVTKAMTIARNSKGVKRVVSKLKVAA
jgi:hyperosmotically inducible protein